MFLNFVARVELNFVPRVYNLPPRWLTHVPRVREVWSLNLPPAKPYTALQTGFNIYASSCVALAL